MERKSKDPLRVRALWPFTTSVILCFLFLSLAFAGPPVEVVYPKEEQVLTSYRPTFIFGNTTPGSSLKINSFPAKVYKNGAFLAVVPTTPGDFTFRVEATNQSGTTVVERRVKVPKPLKTSPSEPWAIEEGYGYPAKDITLGPGDSLRVSFKGSPGGKATFSIEGLAEGLPMTEEPLVIPPLEGKGMTFLLEEAEILEVRGVYTGSFTIPSGKEVKNAKITFFLESSKGEVARAIARCRLTVRSENPPWIGRINGDRVVARTGPGLGSVLLFSMGIRVKVTGAYGEYLRLGLRPSEEAWVRAENVDILPPGTPPPSSRVSTVIVKGLPDKSLVRLPMDEWLPFRIEQSLDPPQYTLSIYGATSGTRWIRSDIKDSFIKEISWSQPETGLYQLKVTLKRGRLWGYRAYYDERGLVLEIRKGPKINRKAPLRGVRVCLDPGHSPDTGAIGPTGLEEKEVNLKIAHLLRKGLLAEGARVTMTRMGDEGISLLDRPRVCAEAGADLLISIHNNALPDGMDPYTNNGYSVYYYYPQSMDLAESLHKSLGQSLRLPDYGLYYGDLALVRVTEMPTALVEPAFIILPEQEALLANPGFQRRIAHALLKGIKQFLLNK